MFSKDTIQKDFIQKIRNHELRRIFMLKQVVEIYF